MQPVRKQSSKLVLLVLILHLFLDLFNNFLHPYLNLLLVLLSLSLFSTVVNSFFSKFLLTASAPSIPFVDETSAVRKELRVHSLTLPLILLFEHSAKFLKILSDLLLLFLRKKRARSWPPQELFKTVLDLLEKLLSAEIPYRVAIFQLQKKTHENQFDPKIWEFILYESTHWRSWTNSDRWDPIRRRSRHNGQRVRDFEWCSPSLP